MVEITINLAEPAPTAATNPVPPKSLAQYELLILKEKTGEQQLEISTDPGMRAFLNNPTALQLMADELLESAAAMIGYDPLTIYCFELGIDELSDATQKKLRAIMSIHDPEELIPTPITWSASAALFVHKVYGTPLFVRNDFFEKMNRVISKLPYITSDARLLSIVPTVNRGAQLKKQLQDLQPTDFGTYRIPPH
jgi:hypothetical protein